MKHFGSTNPKVIGTNDPKGVEAVRVENVHTSQSKRSHASVFIAIGHSPASELVLEQLETHNGGYVQVQAGSTRTSIDGVFAAGDLTDHIYRQAITSAGMGCMAALDAEISFEKDKTSVLNLCFHH